MADEEKPVVKIKRPGNWVFDKNVQKIGYCCRLCFIRINLLERDTIKVLANKASVCVRTIVHARKALTQGKLKCEGRPGCWRALWMTPKEMKIEDVRLIEVKRALQDQQGSQTPTITITNSSERKDK